MLTAKAGASSELLAKLLDAYAAEPDAVDVEVVLSPPGHQAPMLRDGRADVAILHQPYDDLSGFDVDALNVEDQVLILPAGHPLSRALAHRRRGDVDPRPSPAALAPARRELPRRSGPELRDLTQVLQLVRLGRAAIMLPESARINVGEGLAVVPVSDAPRVTTVIAWPPQSVSSGVAGLVRTRRASPTPRLTDRRGRSGWSTDGRRLRGRVVQPDPLARTRRSIVFSHGSGHDQ